MTTFHAFLGCSLDGYIAGPNNELDWLTRFESTGFEPFFGSVDAMLMGRTTYQVMQSIDPTFYRGMPIHVLSTTLKHDESRGVSEYLGESEVFFHQSVDDAKGALAAAGANRVYVDGGQVVQSFIRAGLLTDITVTRVPVLIGHGIPLFDRVPKHITLNVVSSLTTSEGAVQTVYQFPTVDDSALRA